MALVWDCRRCVGFSFHSRYWSNTGSVSDPVSKRRWMVGSIYVETAWLTTFCRALIFNNYGLLATSVVLAARSRVSARGNRERVTAEAPDPKAFLSNKHQERHVRFELKLPLRHFLQVRVKSISGKLTQLYGLPLSQWRRFIAGWVTRKSTGVVPCFLPQSTRILFVSLEDFYASYQFFSESSIGRSELGYFLNRLRPGDIFFDIGAFRGAYGAAAKARLGDTITIHLFDPVPINVESIKLVSQLNHFRRFEIIEMAVGTGNPIAGHIDPKELMFRRTQTSHGSERATMRSVSLDAYTREKNVFPSIIKLDVEGFELDVLDGARRCLLENHPRLWLELHPELLRAEGKRWESALEILRSLGYRTTFFKDYDSSARNTAFHVWCET